MSEEEIIEKVRFKLAIDRNEKLFIDKKILQKLYEFYIEEKEKNKKLNKYIEDRARVGKDIQTFINKDYVNQEYISKDKIREKIKEYETTINQNKLMAIKVRQHGFAQETIIQNMIRAKVEILKELLEENKSDENNI